MCATERIFPAEAWDEISGLAAAREALEAVRWPEGRYCAHCGNADQQSIAKGNGKARRSVRPGRRRD
jgi:Transposase zinc-ribbon domain